MDKNYYQNKIIKQEKNEDKLSYEELMSLKQEFEERGFICKYNQKKEKLREREFCIQDNFYFKKNQVVIDLGKVNNNIESHITFSLKEEGSIPMPETENLLNIDEKNYKINEFSQLNNLLIKNKVFDKINGIRSASDIHAINENPSFSYKCLYEPLYTILAEKRNADIYPVLARYGMGGAGAFYNFPLLVNTFAKHFIYKRGTKNFWIHSVGVFPAYDFAITIFEYKTMKESFSELPSNRYDFIETKLKNYKGILFKGKKYINKKFYDAIERAKTAPGRPFIPNDLAGQPGTGRCGQANGGPLTWKWLNVDLQLYGRKVSHEEDFSEPEEPDAEKLIGCYDIPHNVAKSVLYKLYDNPICTSYISQEIILSNQILPIMNFSRSEDSYWFTKNDIGYPVESKI